MMAWQVAAKTARDSIFLSAYSPRALPAMVAAASVSSVLLALLSARLLRRFGPFRLIPIGYLVGGGLHVVEWLLLPVFTRPVSVIVYIHVLSLGQVLLSGFWAIINEQFDPRSARKRFGRIAGFGTLGGLLGGIMAERVAALISMPALLILLMTLQFACGLFLLSARPSRQSRKQVKTPGFREIFSHAPYLTWLAVLIGLVSMTATMLDFLLKTQVVAHFGRGPALSRFFAVFYMTTSAASFLAQAGASRFWLEKFGLGKTVATLPASVAGAAVLTLFSPGIALLTFSRGMELVLRGSLFRSGYELFYTPMPQAEKRSAKSVIDIGSDRLGDGLAAGVVQAMLVLPVTTGVTCILVLTAVLGSVAAWLAFRLDKAYGVVLGKNLVENAVDLRHIVVEDQSTRPQANPTILPEPPRSKPPEPAVDVQMLQLAELRSGDVRRIRSSLRETPLLDSILVGQVIQLLGREDVWRVAHEALSRSAFRIAGQLVDCLLDPAQDLPVRLRIPRLLGTCVNRLAWDGLFAGLEDENFDMRYRCARALDVIQQRRSEFQPEERAVYRVIARELAVSPAAWRSDPRATVVDEEKPVHVADQVVNARASQSLSHVFCLLSLILPREAVQTAFRALHTEDEGLRALALEYVESVVPRELRDALSARIEAPRVRKKAAPAQQLQSKLLDESPSIVARLEAMAAAPNQVSKSSA